VPKRFGLGGMINTARAPNGRSAGSWAWGGAANTYFWVDPRQRVGGLLLTQIVPFADARVLELFGQFERAVYAGDAREGQP
jgi:methyl acetate hydrolase